MTASRSSGGDGRTAVVIGGTGGLGFPLVLELAARGWSVLATGSTAASADAARLRAASHPGSSGAGPSGPRFLPLDVADPVAALADLESTLEGGPPMELLVWVAGTMPSEESWPELRDAAVAGIPVNLTAPAVVLGWAAERMEARGRGRLAAVGSVAGDRGRKGAPVYGAAKAGLHALLDGLRHRLHGTGVGVTTIRPGWMTTPMLPEALHGHALAVPADRAARIVADGLERGRDLFYVGWWWRIVGAGMRWLPTGLHKRFAPK